MLIIDFVILDCIVCVVDVGGKKWVLEQISEIIFYSEQIILFNDVFESLLVCEWFGGMGVGYGVVILYGCLKSFDYIFGVLIKFCNGIDFDVVD